jgi:Zn-dependent metalloprotease
MELIALCTEGKQLNRFVLWLRGFLYLALFFSVSASFTTLLRGFHPSQGASKREASAGDEAAERSTIETSIRARYRKVETITFDVGPAGVTGLFFIAGDLRPSEEREKKSGDQVQARRPESAAASLLRDEADFLGMTRPDEELREKRRLQDEDGKVHIFFDKYIAGLRVDGMDVRVHMNPDGSVFCFQGSLVSMSPSVKADIAAAARSTQVPEERVRTAIADDIGAGADFVMRAEKVATAVPPYIIWKGSVSVRGTAGNWLYTIDALTGEILSKQHYVLDAGQPKR